jgi:hypothetical protein
MCAHPWATRDDLLADPEVTLVGYQAFWEDLEMGLLMFNHTCGTTLAVEVARFTDLYDGPTFSVRATGTKACPGLCLHRENLNRCPAQCECAYIRELLPKIRNWPKRQTG